MSWVASMMRHQPEAVGKERKKKEPAERFWLFGRISPEKKGKIRRKSRGPLAAFEN